MVGRSRSKRLQETNLNAGKNIERMAFRADMTAGETRQGLHGDALQQTRQSYHPPSEDSINEILRRVEQEMEYKMTSAPTGSLMSWVQSVPSYPGLHI